MLVGRDEETAHLRAALAAAQAGRGGTVLVTGEAGIGKSRLIRETVHTARGRDFVVLAGRAVGGGVPTPFRPFAEALAWAGRAGGLPDHEELDMFRPALGRLVPQWRQWQAPGDESLVFLGEAVLQLLRVLSADAGCLLVLEDLHWADQETLALLEYLADNLAAERVLCVGTLRDEDGGEVAGLASALEARGSAAVLPLGRLDPAAAAQMALACVGAADLPSAVQSLVAERAEGLPFLVEEILAGLIGEGSLTEQDGRWHAGDLARTGVPGTFADAVRRRLDGLDGDARSVICAAAVLGRRFDWALLGPVTGLPDAAVAAALRRGVGLQLVAADGNSFRFRHALTHEAVLAGLLPPERAMLAGQALAAVEAAHSGLPGTWCTLAAELAEGAGDAGRAGTLLLEAGRRDLAVGALASAEHTLMQARMLTGADDVVLRTPVDEALTEVYALSGQVDRAIEMGKTLLARLGGQAESARAGMLHLGIAGAAIAGARWAEAEASIGVARRSADVSAAQVDACAAQVAAGRGLLSEAEELAQAALAVAENAGLPEVACEALEVIGRVARQHDLSAAEQAFERAVAVATVHGLQLWRLRALHELGTIDQLRTESVDRLQQARELTVAGEGRFTLTAEQAFALSDPDGPLYLPGAFVLALASLRAEPRISEAFRTGAGLAWHEQDSEVFDGCEQFFAPGYRANLVQSWIPALDGVEAKLRAGAKVADVGCGHGASTRIMAEAFPTSTFTGYDYHGRSVEHASKAAADAGLGDRVRFAVAPADAFPGTGYDLITAFDCLHDMGHPVAAAARIRQALADDGTFLLVEPAAADDLDGNLNPVGRVYYAFSTLLCVPSALAQEPAVVLGNQAGEARTRQILTEAGFSRFRRAAETPFNLVYEARP